jgi:hypothetical protein
MWPLFLLHQAVHIQGGAALIHHFDLRSTRTARETAWKLKFAAGSTRDAIFQIMDLLSAAPRPFAIQTFSNHNDVLGNICWAARLPDLSACDFFLWCYLKIRVTQAHSTDLESLRLKTSEEHKVSYHMSCPRNGKCYEQSSLVHQSGWTSDGFCF